MRCPGRRAGFPVEFRYDLYAKIYRMLPYDRTLKTKNLPPVDGAERFNSRSPSTLNYQWTPYQNKESKQRCVNNFDPFWYCFKLQRARDNGNIGKGPGRVNAKELGRHEQRAIISPEVLPGHRRHPRCVSSARQTLHFLEHIKRSGGLTSPVIRTITSNFKISVTSKNHVERCSEAGVRRCLYSTGT